MSCDFSSGDFVVPSSARLTATQDFSSSWRAMIDFDRALRWCACVYTVSWKCAPLGAITADCVDVQLMEPPVDTGAPVCRVVWLPPWAKVKKKRGEKAKGEQVESGWDLVPLPDVPGDCGGDAGESDGGGDGQSQQDPDEDGHHDPPCASGGALLDEEAECSSTNSGDVKDVHGDVLLDLEHCGEFPDFPSSSPSSKASS
eukprot:4220265-Pyramimonas_sp.AAC.1